MINHTSSKPLRILIIPYDTNTVQESPSIANLASLIGDIMTMGNKKKSGPDATRKDENSKDKNFVETTKVKIILERTSSENGVHGQEIGAVEIPSTEILGDNLSIVSPKIVISAIEEKHD